MSPRRVAVPVLVRDGVPCLGPTFHSTGVTADSFRRSPSTLYMPSASSYQPPLAISGYISGDREPTSASPHHPLLFTSAAQSRNHRQLPTGLTPAVMCRATEPPDTYSSNFQRGSNVVDCPILNYGLGATPYNLTPNYGDMFSGSYSAVPPRWW